MIKRSIKVLLIIFIQIAMTSPAWAFQAPAADTFGYEIYEFVMQVATGAIGVAIAIGIAGIGIHYVLKSSVMGALTCAAAIVVLVNIEDLVYSLGATF